MDRILPFTTEHKMFQESFSRFVAAEIVPYYDEWEENGIVPREIYKKMGDHGFLCPWVERKEVFLISL